MRLHVWLGSKRDEAIAVALSSFLMIGLIGVALATHSTLHSETLVVNSTSGTGTNTTTTLEAGVLYEALVTGTWTYHPGLGYYSDAECTVTPGTGAIWVREGYADNAGDLMINNAAVEWIPVVLDSAGCSTVQHEYRTYFTPNSKGSVNFSIYDTLYGDNSGTLTVKVSRVTTMVVSGIGVHVENIVVDSSNSNGNWAKHGLKDPGSYTLLASGQFLFATGAGVEFRADAECSSFIGDQFNWERNRYGTGAADSLDLLINGGEVSWNTVRGGPCDSATNLYSTSYVPGSKNLTFRINESGGGFTDNKGLLFVEVFFVSAAPTLGPLPSPSVSPMPSPSVIPIPIPTVPPTPNPTMPPTPNPTLPPTPTPNPQTMVLVDTVTVPSSSAGSTSNVALSDSRSYIFVASGTWVWDNRFSGALADARCETLSTNPQFPDEPGWDQKTRRLLIDGQAVEWVAQTPTPYLCDETDHVYEHARPRQLGSSTATVTFRVQDDVYTDNAGGLTVRIYEIVRPTSSAGSMSGTLTRLE